MRRRVTLAGAILAALGTAACGPENPPSPECPPGEECAGYEPGMTTGKSDEVLDVETSLEEIGEPPPPAGGLNVPDSIIGTDPLSGR